MRLSTAPSAILKIASLLVLSSCGMTIKHEFSGTVNISLDLDKLSEYFVGVCLSEIPDASPEQIESCTKEKVGYFLQTVVIESSS